MKSATDIREDEALPAEYQQTCLRACGMELENEYWDLVTTTSDIFLPFGVVSFSEVCFAYGRC